MSAVRIVVALWGGLYLVLGPLAPPGDGDLWWEHWLGGLILRTHHLPSSLGPETFTSSGVPWIPQEWAFSVLVAFSMDHGVFWILALLVSAIPAAILVSVYLRARAQAAPEAIAAVLVLCGLALTESFGVRAQVVGWLFFAIFWWALERRDGWFYATIPIVAIWSNFHASVLIAPAIVLARIVGMVLDGGIGAVRRSREVCLLPLVLLATVCNPLGWHIPAYAIRVVASPILRFVEEERRVQLSDVAFVLGSLPIALLLLVPKPRDLLRRKAEGLPLAMIFVAMISTARHIPLFAIAAAPLAARNLGLAIPRLRDAGRRIAELEPAALLAVCVAVLLSGLLLVSGQRREPPHMPIAAISSLASHGDRHRVFCENFAWCSIALQFPNLSVFVDGRLDPFPLNVWESYISAVTVKPSWKKILDRYRVDAVVARRGSSLVKKLAADPLWHESFEDERYVVYQRG